MKAMNWLGILAAVGTVTIVSSQASALVCYTPALTFIDDTILANQPVYLACSSRTTAGVTTRAKANGSASATNDRITVTLLEGTKARIGAYNASRQGIGCVAEDFPGGTGTSANCAGQVEYYDVTVEAN